MNEKKHRRGVSVGTVVVLLITAAVSIGLMMILPRLSSGAVVQLNPGQMLEALNLSELVPELKLDDIPIQLPTITQPPETQSPVPPAGTAAVLPAATAAPTAVPRGGAFTMTVGGSVCVETDIRQSGYYKEAKAYDFTELLSMVSRHMDSDLNMVTLENLVIPSAKVSALIAPDAVMKLLSANHVDTVALGFAKVMDKGYDGLASTVAAAQEQRLGVIGAFTEEAAAQAENQIIELGGVRTALLHYTDNLTKAGANALKKSGQSACVPQTDRIAADIAQARDAGAEVVIVSVSWGTVGKNAPTSAQKKLAQQIADAGADVVLGVGPRVVQPTEWLTSKRADGSEKQTLCVYSLGCLISDTRTDGQVAGMLLKLRIACDANGEVLIEQAGYVPTYVWHYKIENLDQYRVVISNQAAPDGMESSQQTSMERALKNVRKNIGSGVLTEIIP